MKRILISILAAFLCLVASAQKQLVIEYDYSFFQDIYATDFFDIVLVPASDCSVKLITDPSMEDYVQAYVKDDAIVLHLDTKGMPKDVKKTFFDAWNGKPRISAEVRMPFVRKVTIDGDSSICSYDEITSGADVEFWLRKTASIPNLMLRSKSFLLSLANKSSAVMSVTASVIEADADSFSSAELEVETDRLCLFTGGFARFDTWGNARSVRFQSEGRSKILFNCRDDKADSGQSL